MKANKLLTDFFKSRVVIGYDRTRGLPAANSIYIPHIRFITKSTYLHGCKKWLVLHIIVSKVIRKLDLLRYNRALEGPACDIRGRETSIAAKHWAPEASQR